MLRVATRAAHDRVDALFAGLNLANPADYRRFMTAQASAFLPAEAALDAAGAAASFPYWDQRRRSVPLRADLDALGLALPAAQANLSFGSPAEVAGGVYVLEGSRLGGAMLARSVAPDLPQAFLTATQPPGQWRIFLDQLEQVLASSVQRREAVTGAGRIFDLFADAARLAVENR